MDDLLHHLLVFVLMLPDLQQLESLFLRAMSPLYPLYTLCVHFCPRQIVYENTEPIRCKLGRNSKPEECLFAQGDICRKVENKEIHQTHQFPAVVPAKEKKSKSNHKMSMGIEFSVRQHAKIGSLNKQLSFGCC